MSGDRGFKDSRSPVKRAPFRGNGRGSRPASTDRKQHTTPFGVSRHDQLNGATDNVNSLENVVFSPPSANLVFGRILRNHEGCAPFPAVHKLLSMKVSEILSWLDRHGDHFLVFKSGRDIKYVGIRIAGAQTCYYYDAGKCYRRDCQYFHLCRKYIAKNCTGQCHRSHSVNDEHNAPLCRKYGMIGYNDGEARYILRSSTLQLCSQYNTNLCCYGDDCRFVHICVNFIRGKCEELSCRKIHSFETEHTKRLLRIYGIPFRMEDEKMKKMVLHQTVRDDAESAVNAHAHPRDKTSDVADSSIQVRPKARPRFGRAKSSTGQNNEDAHGDLLMCTEYEPGTADTAEHSLVAVDIGVQEITLKTKRLPSLSALGRGRQDNTTYTVIGGAPLTTMESTNDPHMLDFALLHKEGHFHGDQDRPVHQKLDHSMPLKGDLMLKAESFICDQFIGGLCSYAQEESCADGFHFKGTFLWRLRIFEIWHSLESVQEIIEKKYSDPENDSITIKLPSFVPGFGGCHARVDFTKLQCTMQDDTSSECIVPVQRLSTRSMADPRAGHDSTRWIWYWKNPTVDSYITYLQNYQDVIECKFLSGHVQMILNTTHSNLVTLNFQKMTQESQVSGESVAIRRRPAPHSR